MAYEKIYHPEAAEVEGEITNYSKDLGDRQARIINLGGRFILLDERYAELSTDAKVAGYETHNTQLYLSNGDLLVLPFRDGSHTQEDMVKITTQFEYNIQA